LSVQRFEDLIYLATRKTHERSVV